MKRIKPIGRAVLATLLLAGTLAACADYITSPDANPNAVPTATADQLFVGTQVNSFWFNESAMSRFASVFMQQMAGTDRQFQDYDTYQIREGDADGPWGRVYQGGGLVDLRKALAEVEEAGRRPYAGILKIHKAFFVGMAASIWGDIPYRQAGIEAQAALDPQAQVYTDVQALLDAAIADLQAAGAPPVAGADFNFAGNAERWIRVAYSLKARFHMHNAEFAQALAAANSGISSVDGNWRAIHTSTSTENNAWFMFMRDRSGYITAGRYLVDLLEANDDPRLEIFFLPDGDGNYTGSAPGEFNVNASLLNIPGLATFDQTILTCSETQFIRAEAALALGQTGVAEAAYEAGIQCQEAYWSAVTGETLTLPRPATPTDLGERILQQKYIALFLNMEAWNDYKRTCLPALQTYQNQPIPRRMYYSGAERRTNPNIPVPALQPLHNPNDVLGTALPSNPCT